MQSARRCLRVLVLGGILIISCTHCARPSVAAQAAFQPKSTHIRIFAVGNGSIYSRSTATLTYGEPSELAAIRPVLSVLCSYRDALSIPGLSATDADELIQVDTFAIAEGSCGNPKLHMLLVKKGPESKWEGDECGTTHPPDARTYGLGRFMENICAFDSDAVDRILLVRAQRVYMPAYAKELRDLKATCSANPQSDVLCPRYRFSASERKFIDYNLSFVKMNESVYRGDFRSALAQALVAMRLEPAYFEYIGPRVAELRRLVRATASGGTTQAQAIAEWQRLELQLFYKYYAS